MENRVVFLLRHGKIQLEDDQRRYVGQIDLPLGDEGRTQARNLARRFEHADIGAIYCSDLARSRETARIIADGGGENAAEAVAREDLREISMGEWEGCTFGDIARRFPDEFKARGADIGGYRVPGGESFAECSGRVVPAFLDILASSSGNIVIVGHAGVNRVLLCHVLGMPVSNVFRIGQDYACLNVIQCSGSGYQVRLINGRGRSGRR